MKTRSRPMMLTTTVGSCPVPEWLLAQPDCGFWMLKRSVADRKMAARGQGRDLCLGRT